MNIVNESGDFVKVQKAEFGTIQITVSGGQGNATINLSKEEARTVAKAIDETSKMK